MNRFVRAAFISWIAWLVINVISFIGFWFRIFPITKTLFGQVLVCSFWFAPAPLTLSLLLWGISELLCNLSDTFRRFFYIVFFHKKDGADRSSNNFLSFIACVVIITGICWIILGFQMGNPEGCEDVAYFSLKKIERMYMLVTAGGITTWLAMLVPISSMVMVGWLAWLAFRFSKNQLERHHLIPFSVFLLIKAWYSSFVLKDKIPWRWTLVIIIFLLWPAIRNLGRQNRNRRRTQNPPSSPGGNP